ncbi:MAG: OB-fold nucleic acid binding domain-containing protein, partial [Gemmatimonadaceae bacterium]
MSKNSPSTRIADLGAHAGQSVEVQGWVTHVRSSGKITFVVIRDGSGTAQVVLVKNEVEPQVWERFG